jgi:hypothetical protein
MKPLYAFARFSISIFFLTLSVLLASLWLRSYSWQDSLVVQFPGANSASIESVAGELRFAFFPVSREWSVVSKRQPSLFESTLDFRPATNPAILPWGPMIGFPCWYLSLVSAAAAGVPWMLRSRRLRRRVSSAVAVPDLNCTLEHAA